MLSDELQKTFNFLPTYMKDFRFPKSSILTSLFAPQFPNSEWSNIIIGSMVDLDHVILKSFAVSNDNREVKVVGGKGEHESGSSTSTCGFIHGKPTGQVTHRSEFLNGTGLHRSG